MMDMPRGEAALEELHWLQTLALRLVRDPDEALDLSQETLLASYRRGPDAGWRRAWLVRTLRNLASKARRSGVRRHARETVAARPEPLPSAEELAARTELQRVLLEVVDGLPEHYRTPILLRYYDGATPTQIAAQLSLPVRTVNTRLRRGMERLRDALDARYPNGRGHWMRAMLTLALLPPREAVLPAPLPPSIGAPWRVAILAGGGALVAVVVVTLVLGGGSSALVGPAGPAPSVPPLPDLVAAPRLTESPGAAAGAPRTPVPPARAEGRVRGQVIDWERAPVRGAAVLVVALDGVQFPRAAHRPPELMLGAAEARHVTTEAGEFAVPARGPSLFVRAEAPGLVCVVDAAWREERATQPLCIVMAPVAALRRRVVDVQGQPLAGVEVVVSMDEAALARFPQGFRSSELMHWETLTDARGEFDLPAVPQIAEARVTLHRADVGTAAWNLPELPAALCLGGDGDRRIAGRVTDPQGAPLPGITILSDLGRTESASDGSFVMNAAEGATLWLAGPGWAATGLELRDPALAPTIALQTRSVTWRGRVVDAEGQPLPGHEVWLDDPSLAGTSAAPLVLESFAAGGRGFSHSVRTRADGTFRLRGLDPRRQTYALRVLNPKTTAWFVSQPRLMGGGNDAFTVSAPADLYVARLRGRVVDRHGRPLEGVEVVVQGPGYGVGASRVYTHGASARSDADGAYELDRVPRRGVWLRAERPDLFLATREIEAIQREPAWRLSRSARLQIGVADPTARTVRLVDEAGAAITVWAPAGSGRRSIAEIPLHHGRTVVVEVPCHAVAVVVTSDGAARRFPLRLTPGQHHDLWF
ncbi:MAG: sigma-70 family RNA polymerase sigma factor [Planctomycetota bacterium]